MEIVYVCNSLNNKNVRDGELVILRKNEKELYFEFGENEKNIKKRFYANAETLNKDYEEVSEIKEKLDKEKNNKAKVEEVLDEEVVEEIKPSKFTKKDEFKKTNLF